MPNRVACATEGGHSEAAAFATIEALAWLRGRVRRGDLCATLGVASATASRIIARYRRRHPANLVPVPRHKAYAPAAGARPVYLAFEPAHLLDWLARRAQDGPWTVAAMPTPWALPPADVVAAVARALAEPAVVRVRYHQLRERAGPTLRRIVPVGLFQTVPGRWYLRALTLDEAGGFRDLALARIESVAHREPWKGASPHTLDPAWGSEVELVLVPHPRLPAAGRRAVALDYGMRRPRGRAGPERRIRMPAVVAPYFVLEFRVDATEGRRLDPRLHRLAIGSATPAAARAAIGWARACQEDTDGGGPPESGDPAGA